MNVLLVYPGFFTGKRIGGAERHIYDLGRCLLERGNKPVILAWNSPKSSLEVSNGILIHSVKISSRFRARWYTEIFALSLQVAYLVRKYRIDLIHAHDYLPGLVSTLASIFVRKPVVVTFHLPIWKTTYRLPTRLNTSFLLKQILKKFFIFRVSVIICVSNFTYQETLKLGFPARKLKVIYNWITPSLKCKVPAPNYIRKMLGLRKNYLILSVGRLDSQKGFSILIHALHILLDEGNNLDLAIVGEGPDRDKLMQYSKKLGVENNVHFLRNVSDSDLACLYSECDIFVQSSLIEGLSLVIIEAMKFGKPIVATKVGGTPEVLKNGYNGVLVNPNPESLASGIKTILLNPDLKETFAKGSQETAKNFSIKNCYDTIALLENVFKSK